MIYTELTNKALKIAYEVHHGQVDKGGIPYIFHPYHLAEQMDDEISTCAALLHDVVEDTDVTFKDLEKDFPPAVIEVLKLLTHADDEDYYVYINRLKDNPIAKKIKLADIAHNSDQSRLVGTDKDNPETKEYFRKKYAKAIEILNG